MTPAPWGEPPLACSICDADTRRHFGAFVCKNGHSFDIAKEGYVNLLPSQHRRRGIGGDLLQMVRARRRFLDAGYFRPLLDELAAQVRALLARDDGSRRYPVVVETGCGEGHYVGNIAAAAPRDAVFLGTDLSKAAVKMAARRYGDVLFFVSDVHKRVYLRDASVDVILDVFAPRNPDEFARVLRPGGRAIIVIPSEDHLAGLRERYGLLEVEEDKERKVLDRMAEGFRLADKRELRYALDLPPDAVRDVIAMGPNAWHRAAGPVEEPGDRPAEEPGEEPREEPVTTQAAFVLLGLERL